jgi:hypothetical protein
LRCSAAAECTIRRSARACGVWAAYPQPLALPATLDPVVVVDCPARPAQHFGDLAIARSAVVPGKLDDIGGETLPDGRAGLALRRARAPRRREARRHVPARRADLLNSGAATRVAWTGQPDVHASDMTSNSLACVPRSSSVTSVVGRTSRRLYGGTRGSRSTASDLDKTMASPRGQSRLAYGAAGGLSVYIGLSRGGAKFEVGGLATSLILLHQA